MVGLDSSFSASNSFEHPVDDQFGTGLGLNDKHFLPWRQVVHGHNHLRAPGTQKPVVFHLVGSRLLIGVKGLGTIKVHPGKIMHDLLRGERSRIRSGHGTRLLRICRQPQYCEGQQPQDHAQGASAQTACSRRGCPTICLVLFHAQPSEQLLAAKLPIRASIRLVTFQTLVKFDHRDMATD